MISVAFGCPYEGHVPPERVFEIARRLAAAGAQEIGFGDTTGMANPVAGRARSSTRARDGSPDVELTAHFHNTRGQGLANVSPRSRPAATSFESSFGELGGCPVPRRRDRQHRHRGSRLDARTRWASRPGSTCPRCSPLPRAVREQLGRPLGSHTLVAGPIDWHRSLARCSTRVLIANRGEIARRAIRARCDRLGIGSAAVVHRRRCRGAARREAVCALQVASYLDVEAILAGVRRVRGAQALHPGYGFLSENAGFARACEPTRGWSFDRPAGRRRSS